MSKKNESIKKDRLDRLYTFLCYAHERTNSGYTEVSMSELIRSVGITSVVAEIIAAARSLGILKQMGSKRYTKWLWAGDQPSAEMAEIILTEVSRIRANERIKRDEQEKIQRRGLVPIIKKDRGYAGVVDVALRSMYKNSDELFTEASAKEKYGLTAESFRALVDLDVVKEHTLAKGSYKWSHGQPTLELIEMVASAVNEHERAEQTGPETPATKKDVINKSILSMLEEIKSNAPYEKKASDILAKYKLSKIYMSKAVSLGIVKNVGIASKPSYVVSVHPTTEVAVKINDAVSHDWKMGSRDKRARMKGINVAKVDAPQRQTTAATVKNYPDMLEKATRRKAYLESELQKVNKVIDAINTVNNLVNEISFD